jgi:WD40 repeat protein
MRRSSPKRSKPMRLLVTYAACFARDDSMLATLSKDVVVWDVEKRAKRYRVHPVSHPSDCDFNPRGSRLAVKTTHGAMLTLDAKDGSDVRVIADGSEGEGTRLMYSPCSEFLVDGSWAGSLTVRDASTGAIEFRRQGEGEMVEDVCADATRQTWAIHHCHQYPSRRPDYVSLWTWPFREPKLFELMSQDIHAFALSADGKLIAACARVYGKGHHLTIHSVLSFEIVASLWLDEAPYVKGLCWSPDGKELAFVRKGGFSFYRFPELSLAATFELKYAADIAYVSTGRSVVLCDWECGLLLDREAIQHVRLNGGGSHA